MNTSTTISGSIKAAQEAITLTVEGYVQAAILLSGTWAGTIVIEGTIDGSTWTTLEATPIPTATAVTSMTANGQWIVQTAGFAQIRARISAYTSGSVKVTIRAVATGGGSGGSSTGESTPSDYAVDDTAMPATPNVNPMGLEYRATPTTYTDGDATVAQADQYGNLKVTLATALSAALDSISAKLATDAIMNGTTELTPKFAVINTATSGNNTLVAAVTGKKIRVLAVYARVAGAMDIRFESGADGTALSGVIEMEATDPLFVLPFNPVGWFETAAATLLNLELSAATSIDGGLVYVEV